MVETYCNLVDEKMSSFEVSEEDKKQLEYFSLYFLQVLTLDRGTTSGLLIHNDNDVGVWEVFLLTYLSLHLLLGFQNESASAQDKLLSDLISCQSEG